MPLFRLVIILPSCVLFVMKMSSHESVLPPFGFNEDICCLLTVPPSGYVTALFQKGTRGKSFSMSLHVRLCLDTSFSLGPH